VQSNSKYWRTKDEEDKTNKKGSSQVVVVSGDERRQTIQKKQQALGPLESLTFLYFRVLGSIRLAQIQLNI